MIAREWSLGVRYSFYYIKRNTVYWSGLVQFGLILRGSVYCYYTYSAPRFCLYCPVLVVPMLAAGTRILCPFRHFGLASGDVLGVSIFVAEVCVGGLSMR